MPQCLAFNRRSLIIRNSKERDYKNRQSLESRGVPLRCDGAQEKAKLRSRAPGVKVLHVRADGRETVALLSNTH